MNAENQFPSAGFPLFAQLGAAPLLVLMARTEKPDGAWLDLDGAFGDEQTPQDLETVADLAKLPNLLAVRSGSANNTADTLHRNFVEFLQRARA